MDAAVPSTDLRPHASSLLRAGAWGYAVTVGGLVLAAGLLLSVRRLSGGLAVPLAPALLLPAVIAAIGLALTVRDVLHWLDRAVPSRVPRVRTECLLAVPFVGLLVVATAVSIPGTPVVALASMWVLVSGTVAMVLVAEVRHGKRDRPVRPVSQRATRSWPVAADEVSESSESEDASDDVFQQLQRGKTDEGQEFCCGWVRTEFEKGQRIAAIHLAFCPPLLATPEMHVDQIEGPPVQIKVAQLLPYGVRLELRLDQSPSESTRTRIEFSALAPSVEPPIAGA